MKQFGPHLTAQGSVMGPQVEELLPVEVLYSDPPWGDGMLKRFASTVEKATGMRPAQPSFEQVCERFGQLTESVSGHVFLEVGQKSHGLLLEAVRPHLSDVSVTPFYYGSNIQAVLIYGNRGGGAAPDLSDLGKLKGLPFVKHILGKVAVPGARVLDPCCGAGYTARAAVHHGMLFRGNELNPARLEKTESFLRSFSE